MCVPGGTPRSSAASILPRFGSGQGVPAISRRSDARAQVSVNNSVIIGLPSLRSEMLRSHPPVEAYLLARRINTYALPHGCLESRIRELLNVTHPIDADPRIP